MGVRQNVSNWFLKNCGSVFPASNGDWEKCFLRLCEDVDSLVRYCIKGISTIAASEIDRDVILGELKRRLDREWEPYRFDQMISDSAARLGEQINARSFRDRRLSAWQRQLASIPDGVDSKIEMERIIDGEIANHFRHKLPIRTQQIIDELELEPGPAVKLAVEVAQRIFADGIREPEEILRKLKAEYGD